MPSHPTRRGLLALLTLLFVFVAVIPPAQARIPYVKVDGDLEGDPGDGVLKPATFVKPTTTLDVTQTEYATATAPVRAPVCLPVFLLPSGLPGQPAMILLPAAAVHGAGFRWSWPVDRPSGGRWHDAR